MQKGGCKKTNNQNSYIYNFNHKTKDLVQQTLGKFIYEKHITRILKRTEQNLDITDKT